MARLFHFNFTKGPILSDGPSLSGSGFQMSHAENPLQSHFATAPEGPQQTGQGLELHRRAQPNFETSHSQSRLGVEGGPQVRPAL